MSDLTVIHSTFVLERSFSAPPERVFAAFADPAKKRRWFAEGRGHEVDAFEMDFRTGGSEHTRLTFGPGTPISGAVCVNSGSYLDIIAGRRLVTASSMTINGKCISASLVTMEFLPSGTGTDLVFTHQGAFFEGADGPEMREAGWRTLFERLQAELAR